MVASVLAWTFEFDLDFRSTILAYLTANRKNSRPNQTK